MLTPQGCSHLLIMYMRYVLSDERSISIRQPSQCNDIWDRCCILGPHEDVMKHLAIWGEQGGDHDANM